MPFFIRYAYLSIHVRRTADAARAVSAASIREGAIDAGHVAQAGLLASGLAYLSPLPVLMAQWVCVTFVTGYSGGSATDLHRSSLAGRMEPSAADKGTCLTVLCSLWDDTVSIKDCFFIDL